MTKCSKTKCGLDINTLPKTMKDEGELSTITERIDNITTLTQDYAMTAPPAPKSVKIELTGRCNFECFFCARSQRLREVNAMDKDLFKRLLVEMREAGVEEIGLFYLGESFLVPWIAEAVEWARKECGYPYIFLTTNGSITTPKKVEACMKAGLNSLKFSYNYADEDQFKEIARVKGAYFQKMKDNMKEAWRIREEGNYDCGLYASYIQYDGEQGEKMLEAVEEIRPYVDEVYGLPLYNQASLIENDQWEFTQGNRGRLDNMQPSLPCWSIFTEGHVAFDGTLSACCFDHDKRFDMGNLTEMSFMEAWHSDTFQKLRQKHLDKDVTDSVCESCVVWG